MAKNGNFAEYHSSTIKYKSKNNDIFACIWTVYIDNIVPVIWIDIVFAVSCFKEEHLESNHLGFMFLPTTNIFRERTSAVITKGRLIFFYIWQTVCSVDLNRFFTTYHGREFHANGYL